MINLPPHSAGRSGRPKNENRLSPAAMCLDGVKGLGIAGNSGSTSFPAEEPNRIDRRRATLPAPIYPDNGNERARMSTIKELAENSGATLAPELPGRELISFEILRSGDIAIELSDGTKTSILARRHLDGAALPPRVVTAEGFLDLMGRYAALPIGARPEGRRFIRRTAIAADGKPCLRFSEAGRDV